MDRFGETVKFKVNADNMNKVRETFKIVYDALEVKGYNPVNQIGPKLMSQITERRQKLIADAKNTAVRKAQEKAYAEYLKKKQAEDAFWNQQ